MAGFTFSSLPPDNMSITPPQIMKSTANKPAIRTIRETPIVTISPGAYATDGSIMGAVEAAWIEGMRSKKIGRKLWNEYIKVIL